MIVGVPRALQRDFDPRALPGHSLSLNLYHTLSFCCQTSFMGRPTQVVGSALAEALPNTKKHWFQQPHLLKLNLILFIPMLSSTVVGYDGEFCFPNHVPTNEE